MRVVDLSHPIAPGMPVYPGTEPPRCEAACTVAEHGFAEARWTFYTHTGTHLDAPAHLLAGGQSLDDFPAGHFLGRAVALDLGPAPPDLDAWARRLQGCDFALLRTGWSRLWGSPGYFEGFPTPSIEAARRLAALGLRGVGIDALSVDPVGSADLPVHRVLLGAGLVIAENLRGLEALPEGPFGFSCLPLRLAGADGSPVRAVALLGS
ncbi:MAG: cyclase family protein [Deferrisomatales bacterium]